MRCNPHTVELTAPAEKDLRALRAHRARVVRELLVLERDPHAGVPKAGSLRGVRALGFSLPGGEYRAAYIPHPHKPNVCLVFIIGSHENFYAKAEQRLRALRKTTA
jgi:hypothetical protein